MPDVPAQPDAILADSHRRAGTLADRLDALARDLAHPEPTQSLSPADRSAGLAKLEAAIAALREVAGLCDTARLCDTADPSCPDAPSQHPPTP